VYRQIRQHAAYRQTRNAKVARFSNDVARPQGREDITYARDKIN